MKATESLNIPCIGGGGESMNKAGNGEKLFETFQLFEIFLEMEVYEQAEMVLPQRMAMGLFSEILLNRPPFLQVLKSFRP